MDERGRSLKMEQFVTRAKQLVAAMRENEEPIGKMEGYYVERYAFYADDFESVEELAREFAKRGYEKRYGIIDRKFIESKQPEMDEKREKLGEFVKIIRQASHMIAEGFAVLEQMEIHLQERELFSDFKHYLEHTQDREGIKKEFEEKGREGITDVRSR